MQLVAKNCVNTMPEATLTEVKNNGVFTGDSITNNYQSAKLTLAQLANARIDLDQITKHLEIDGVSKFENAWLELIESVKLTAGR
jgi:transaldolase